MKTVLTLLAFVLMMVHPVCFAGDKEGHGGDPLLTEFYHRAKFVLYDMEIKRSVSAPLLQTLKLAVDELRGEVTDEVLPTVGRVVKDPERPGKWWVRLDRKKWTDSLANRMTVDVNVFVAHEAFETKELDFDSEITRNLRFTELDFMLWYQKYLGSSSATKPEPQFSPFTTRFEARHFLISDFSIEKMDLLGNTIGRLTEKTADGYFVVGRIGDSGSVDHAFFARDQANLKLFTCPKKDNCIGTLSEGDHSSLVLFDKRGRNQIIKFTGWKSVQATAANSQRMVVGRGVREDGTKRAVLVKLENRTIEDLAPTPNMYEESEAVDINETGVVCGNIMRQGKGPTIAFVQKSVATLIPPADGDTFSSCVKVNNNGHALIVSGNSTRSMLYLYDLDAKELVPLLQAPILGQFKITAFNDSDLAVGWVVGKGGKHVGVIFAGGSAVELNSLHQHPEYDQYDITEAIGISNSGQIAVHGVLNEVYLNKKSEPYFFLQPLK